MTTRYGGYAGKVLDINLTTESTEEYSWTDKDRELYKIYSEQIQYRL